MYPVENNGTLVDAGMKRLPWHIKAPNPQHYWNCNYVVLDFETTNIEFGHARVPENNLVCASWLCLGQRGFKRGNEYEQSELIKLVGQHKLIVAHHAKFELQWLQRMGADISQLLVYDTMLGDYVLAGNRRWPLDLGSMSRRYGGTGKESIVDAMIQGGVSPEDIPENWIEARVRKDVEDTHNIFIKQRDKLQELDLLKTQYTRCLLTPVLADMEMQQQTLSAEHVEKATAEARRIEDVYAREFSAMTGGINSRSTKQMAEYVYGTLGFEELKRRGVPIRNKPSKAFPDGAPKVDTQTLDSLKATTGPQKEFIALRKKLGKVQAELSKTLEFFDGVCRERGGKFYGQFNQAVTQTHRLSSSGVPVTLADGETRRVQFQNFPNKFKELIGASGPGRLIGEIDGMQLEFRGAAFLGGDAQAYIDIVDDADIHRFTASVINNVDESCVTPEQRKKAKPHTFKPLYGGQSGTAAEVRYYEAFRAKYSQIFDTQTGWTREVLYSPDKCLKTITGLRFYFPGTKQRDSGYVENTPSIFNYPVQSFCTAEIIPIALVYLWHRTRASGDDWKFQNTVHDSVVLDIPDDEQTLDKFKQRGLQCFSYDVYRYMREVYGIKIDVPLGAGFKIGKRWTGDVTHEDEINVQPNGFFWRKGTRG